MKVKNIKKRNLYIADILLYLLIILIDRIAKYFVIIRLKNNPALLIFNSIELKYIENRGAALGIMRDQKYFFFLFSIILIIISLYCLYKTPAKNKYNMFHIFIVFIVSGSGANTIDRIIYGNVIDYICLYRLNFPVFNIADIFITIGSIALFFIILFFFKEDDLNFLRFNEKKIRDI